MKKKAEPEVTPPPSIAYSRYLTLKAPNRNDLHLSHLRALVREADERGYHADTHISVYVTGVFGGEVRITVGGGE